MSERYSDFGDVASIFLRYTYQCSRCPASCGQDWPIPHGGEIPRPEIPPGWQWLGDRLICPKHRVRVEDAKPTFCSACGRSVIGPTCYSQTIPCSECPKEPSEPPHKTVGEDFPWMCVHCGYTQRIETRPNSCPKCQNRACSFGEAKE